MSQHQVTWEAPSVDGCREDLSETNKGKKKSMVHSVMQLWITGHFRWPRRVKDIRNEFTSENSAVCYVWMPERNLVIHVPIRENQISKLHAAMWVPWGRNHVRERETSQAATLVNEFAHDCTRACTCTHKHRQTGRQELLPLLTFPVFLVTCSSSSCMLCAMLRETFLRHHKTLVSQSSCSMCQVCQETLTHDVLLISLAESQIL